MLRISVSTRSHRVRSNTLRSFYDRK
jgi:hypothetical protein